LEASRTILSAAEYLGGNVDGGRPLRQARAAVSLVRARTAVILRSVMVGVGAGIVVRGIIYVCQLVQPLKRDLVMRTTRLLVVFVSVATAFQMGVMARAANVAQVRPILIAQAATPAQRSDARAQTVDDVFQKFTNEWVRTNPDLARRTRYLTTEEQDPLERQLTPWTQTWRRARIQLARSGLTEVQSLDRASMTDAQRLSAEVMQWQLETIIDGEPYYDNSFPLQQFQGANVALVDTLVVVHPLRTARDAENYVAALGQVAERLEEATVEAQRRAANGVLPPNFILRATIAQMRGFIAPPAGQNPFVATFAQKMVAISALSDQQRALLQAQAEQVVQSQIYPAWRQAIALLESQLPSATDDAGLWRFSNGAAAYAYFLRRATTTDMTPDQIHELGLRQVEVIDRQMDEILRRLGRTDGSVKNRIDQLRQDTAYLNPASDESRGQTMRDIELILRDAEKRATLLFDKTPKAPVVTQPFPRFLEANAAANYSTPPADGSRPGVFQFPLRREWMTKFGLRSIVYHETVPGHHFDLALGVENKDLPAFRRLDILGAIAARVEGWGLYAERLAAESGWYEDDLEGLLGQLYWEQFRARRLVVDTGLHAKHWTRQQAIDYGIEPAEVERYVVNPGQACSYMIGELKILELREKAKKALGRKFSLKEFHNMVLDTGIVPLEILERQTDAFIARIGRSRP
jgi:uncharacterized protein (DUF885 family)